MGVEPEPCGVRVSRIRHEHNHVMVPKEIRAKVLTIPYRVAAKYLGVSNHTLDALRQPGGAIREDVLERVRELLK